MVPNNVVNHTPGRIQTIYQPNLRNAASLEYIFTRNTLFTGEDEDAIEISVVTNSTNTGLNPTINCPSGSLLSKPFSIQQSHLIQVVTDLSVQMNEVDRKLDLLLARASLPQINHREDTFTVPEFLANLPVKDNTSFCNLNEQLKNSHNIQSLKSAKKIYDDVTNEHFEEIISDWLNQAKVRIRRRAARQTKAWESEASGYNLGCNE